MSSEELTTITISKGVEKKLEALKGPLHWDAFLDAIADHLATPELIKAATNLENAEQRYHSVLYARTKQK